MRVLDPLGRTALHYCKDNKSTKIAAMLLNRDLSIIDVRDVNGYTALQMSVMAGNHQMVNFLIRNGADARTRDSEQRTLIHWATGQQSIFIVMCFKLQIHQSIGQE